MGDEIMIRAIALCLLFFSAICSAQTSYTSVVSDSGNVTTAWDSISTARMIGTVPYPTVALGRIYNLGATNWLYVAFENDTTASKIIRIAPGQDEYILGHPAKWIRTRSAASTTTRLYNLHTGLTR
jgi:hypothetical protein